MNKEQKITITTSDGKEYPCRVTLGAMRRFKRETGIEADQIKSPSELGAFIWCCCLSAANADGVEFDVSLDDFCDRLDMSQASMFTALVSGEKKTK